MKLDLLGVYLELETYEIFERLKRFERIVKSFLKETDSNQKNLDLRLNAQDIRSITAIAKNCRSNSKLMNLDCLLEIITMYYYIMDIFHDDYNTGDLENYFGILNLTDILITYIGYFSKPYVQSNLRRHFVVDVLGN
jgi:hypothetical protein